MSLVRKLMKKTGADKATAQYLLEACGDDYKMAVSMYADIQPPTQGTSSGGEDDGVRAPIPPKFEVLCPETPMPLHNTRRSAWAAGSSNTAHLRDFEHETRLQEEMLGLGRGIFGAGLQNRSATKDGAGPSTGSAGEGDKLSRDKLHFNSKLKKLEDLFKPPHDIIYKGSFFMARDEGKKRGQWLLANIQDNQSFVCHMLNRDVWSNGNVRKLLADTFLLWQAADDSEHGRKYISFYPTVSFPYIAIIDSRTGEHMCTFNETDPKAFCLFLKQFISKHGKLPNDAQYELDHQHNGAASGKRKSPSSPHVNGVETPPKLQRTEPGDVSSSSPSAAGGEAADVLGSRGHHALVDITEEDQMKLAIAESLKACQSNSPHVEDNEVSDDGDVVSLNGSSDDENEINYSFDDHHEPSVSEGSRTSESKDINSGLGGSPAGKSKEGSTSRSRPGSEWRAAKVKLTNGTLQASDMSSSRSQDAENDEQKWQRLAAKYDNSDDATIALRLPDGARETICLPRAAPLSVLRLCLRSKGYCSPEYRAFTGWPKKDLLEMLETLSLRDAGLLSRDTVILQQE